MTPPAAILSEYTEADLSMRPSKKQKVEQVDPSFDDSTAAELGESLQVNAVRRHPLGVRPSGNAFTAKENLKTACGFFTLLPDELLAQFLEYLNAADLLRLGGTCRALHAFTRSEELWRALFVE